jgi:hypothetical protein
MKTIERFLSGKGQTTYEKSGGLALWRFLATSFRAEAWDRSVMLKLGGRRKIIWMKMLSVLETIPAIGIPF